MSGQSAQHSEKLLALHAAERRKAAAAALLVAKPVEFERLTMIVQCDADEIARRHVAAVMTSP